MSFYDFEPIGDGRVKCKTCGAEIPMGIFNISAHWHSCAGKGFHDAIVRVRQDKGGPLTEGDAKLINDEWGNSEQKGLFKPLTMSRDEVSDSYKKTIDAMYKRHEEWLMEVIWDRPVDDDIFD